jgi:glucose/arabinose dehydrogenase
MKNIQQMAYALILFMAAMFLAEQLWAQEEFLSHIRLPKGFSISLYAHGVLNAREMAASPKGTIFVGTTEAGKVYALRDMNNDHRADQIYTIARGLNKPNGVAFRNGSLYVTEINRVLRRQALCSCWSTVQCV